MKHTLLLSVAVGSLLVTIPRTASSDPPGNAFQRRNLVSDLRGHATHRDPNLVNPWGIAFSPTGPFWIADNHTGLSTVYDASGNALALVVTIPPPAGGQPPASPTGMVFNGTPSFALKPGLPALFIFATEDGTISGWNSADATHAALEVDNSASGAVYKGLATANNGSGNFLYATNFNAGTVDVFDANFKPAMTGSFKDSTIPAGFAPFGIQNIGGGRIVVTYAKQDADKHDDVPGPGNGYVNVFDTNGTLQHRLISGGALNSPWGITISPATFGDFGNSLIIGNFGDGTIHAFDQESGALHGTLSRPNGRPITIQGLWAVTFGNGGQAGDRGILYFTAGIPGPDSIEDHGLFGSIRPLGKNEEGADDDQGH